MNQSAALTILTRATDPDDKAHGWEIRRALRALQTIRNWQPGHTAPTDRPIDIWVNGRRYVDCTYNEAHNRFQYVARVGRGDSTVMANRIIFEWPECWMDIPPKPGDDA